MSNNHVARYWKYTGNHADGRDCPRRDPHGYGLNVVTTAAYLGNGGSYSEPLAYEDTLAIQVKDFKGDNFGHEVEVKAPPEVWSKVKTWAAQQQVL